MAIRITYNGNNIDLKIDDKGLVPVPTHEFNENISGSGKIEQINQYGLEEVMFYATFDDAVYRQLYTWWWSWARFGKVFSFALDSSKTVNTTLDGSTSGATIPLTTTTDLSIGDECIIEADGDNEREIIVINSISTGSVDADANLINSFVSGDAFRHKDYFPSLKNTDKKFKPQRVGQNWTNVFKWVEKL